MQFFKKKKILVTHNRAFHADDIFACATLSLLLEKNNEKFKIIRTRDEKIIKSADYVFDVGGIYDENLNRFDHHQKGGAGKRENGIEYSSFGLVWKKFGKELCASSEVVEKIDKELVVPIDAIDNGIDLSKNIFENISDYTINNVFSIFSTTSLEKLDKDKQFLKALVWAKEILSREIKKTSDEIKITKIVQNFYKNSKDKRLVVIDEPKVSRYEVLEALQDFVEPLFAIYGDNEGWSVLALRKERGSHESKKDFPKEWGGQNGEDLQKITGVSDAIFCHKGLFLAGTKTKEGAIKLAELALLG